MKTSSLDNQIYVRSHVARDLLQSAGLFKTDKHVVWEYVSNGLQYVEAVSNPVVKVELDSKKKKISIADNGRGMDWNGLKNFFVMHGENLDRKTGQPGRGRFGTGKSAAFGIANVLRISTINNNKRSIVELKRSEIESMSSEDPIPVKIIEKEKPVVGTNGTLIEIQEVNLRSLDQSGIIAYIQRHLARWPKNVTVFVNNHQCEFSEPPVAKELKFYPDDSIKNILGNVELTLKVAKAPLEEDLRGVSMYSKGVWHETTLAGNEGREMAQYIFGDIDIPKLEEDSSPISPFDVSRSMTLNPNNEIVQQSYVFIGQCVDQTRRELVEVDKKRKQSDELQRLKKQADDIAKVINEDFFEFRDRLATAKSKAKSAGVAKIETDAQQDSGNDDLIFGDQIPAEIISETGGFGSDGKGGGGGDDLPNVAPTVKSTNDSSLDKRGKNVGGEPRQQRSRAGFQVDFKQMGAASHRAQYLERVIYINLDHPQMVAAKGLETTEDPTFRRLAYEVAFSEYAIALAYELDKNGQYLDPSDPIFDIRETINRLATKGARLYSN